MDKTMIYKMSDNGKWYYHINAMHAMLAMAAHLHLALLDIHEHGGLQRMPMLRPLLFETSTIIKHSTEIKKGHLE